MTQRTYPGQLSLAQLEVQINGDEAAGFRLKALDHDATLTMADYKMGKRPKNPVELKKKPSKVPDTHDKVCDGKVLDRGVSTEVTAIRKKAA
jgi:hypothetical protein